MESYTGEETMTMVAVVRVPLYGGNCTAAFLIPVADSSSGQ